VRLVQDRALDYRIVAPTEWNFHPRGALAADLVGSTAPDPAAARHRAQQVVHSLDPCVACVVEVVHA
jgi:Ni,Fe-hydrogenase I large subunit